jgi:hypothetical protein
MDAHSQSWERVAAAQAVQVLRANLIGALYYIASVALIVPLVGYYHRVILIFRY